MQEAYRVELASILDVLGEQILLDEDVSLEPIEVGTQTFAPVLPAHISVSLTNTGTGVVAQGTIAVDLAATCARCLQDFTLHATGDVEGFYVSPAHSHDLPEEQEYELIHDRAVDLMPALVAAVAIDLPFAPLHDPDCRGICSDCGIDLNTATCECQVETDDSPFSALKELFPQDQEE